MKKNLKLIFVFVLLFLFITPFYVYAGGKFTPGPLSDKIAFNPIGPDIDEYRVDNSRFVDPSYTNTNHSRAVGALVKFYYYSPPANPVFGKKGTIKQINSVLFYNPDLMGDYVFEYITIETKTVTNWKDHPTKQLKYTYHDTNCGQNHTAIYDIARYYSYNYPVPKVSLHSKDLHFDVDRIEETYDYNFKTKDNYTSFEKEFLQEKISDPSYFGGKSLSSYGKLENIYYSIEPVYLYYSMVTTSSFTDGVTKRYNNYKHITSTGHNGPGPDVYKNYYRICPKKYTYKQCVDDKYMTSIWEDKVYYSNMKIPDDLPECSAYVTGGEYVDGPNVDYDCDIEIDNILYKMNKKKDLELTTFLTTPADPEGKHYFTHLAYNQKGDPETVHLRPMLDGPPITEYYLGPDIETAMVVFFDGIGFRNYESINVRLMSWNITPNFYCENEVDKGCNSVRCLTCGIKYYHYLDVIKQDRCREFCSDPNSSIKGLQCAIDFCDGRQSNTVYGESKAKRKCLINDCGYKPPSGDLCTNFEDSDLYQDVLKDGVDSASGCTNCSYINTSKTEKAYSSSAYRGSYAMCQRMGETNSRTEKIKTSDGDYNIYPYSDSQTYVDVACKDTNSTEASDISNTSVNPGGPINYNIKLKTTRKCIVSFDHNQWTFDYLSLSRNDLQRKYLMLLKLESWERLSRDVDRLSSINGDGAYTSLSGIVFSEDGIASSNNGMFYYKLSAVEGHLPRFFDLSIYTIRNRMSITGSVVEVIKNKLSEEGMDVYGGTIKFESNDIVSNGSYFNGGDSPGKHSFTVSILPDSSNTVHIYNDYDFKVLRPGDPGYNEVFEKSYLDTFRQRYFNTFRHSTSTHSLDSFYINESIIEYYTFPSVCVSNDGNAKISLKKANTICKGQNGRALSSTATDGYKSYFTSLNATPDYSKTISSNPTVKSSVVVNKVDILRNIKTDSSNLNIEDSCPYSVLGEKLSCSISSEYITNSNNSYVDGIYNLSGDSSVKFRLHIDNNLQEKDEITEYGLYKYNSGTDYNGLLTYSITKNDIDSGSWYYDDVGTYTYTNTYKVKGVVKTKNGKTVSCTKEVKVSNFEVSSDVCSVRNYGSDVSTYNFALFNYKCPTGYTGSEDARTCISDELVPKIRASTYVCVAPSELVGSDGQKHPVFKDLTKENTTGDCYADICYYKYKYKCDTSEDNTCILTSIDNNDLKGVSADNKSYDITATDQLGNKYSSNSKYYCSLELCDDNSKVICKMDNFVGQYDARRTLEYNYSNLGFQINVRVYRTFDAIIPDGKIIGQSAEKDTNMKDLISSGIDIYINTDEEEYYTKDNKPVLIDSFTIGTEDNCDRSKIYAASLSSLASKLSKSGTTIKKLKIKSKNGSINSLKKQIESIHYPMDTKDPNSCAKIESNVEYEKKWDMICPPGTFIDYHGDCHNYASPTGYFGNNHSKKAYIFTSANDNTYNGMQFVSIPYNEEANAYFLDYDFDNATPYVLFDNEFCKMIDTEDTTQCINLTYKPADKVAIDNYCSSKWAMDKSNYSSYEECSEQCGYRRCPSDPLVRQDYKKLESWCKEKYYDLGYASFGYCINVCYPAQDGDYVYRPININNPFPYSEGSKNVGYISGNRLVGKNWIGLDADANPHGLNNIYYSFNLNASTMVKVKRYNQSVPLYYTELQHSKRDRSCGLEGFCSVFVHEKFRSSFTKLPTALDSNHIYSITNNDN